MAKGRRIPGAPHWGEALGWFQDNLELLVEDARIEDRVDIYFDTEDLRAVVLGMYSFYDVELGGFRWKNFQKNGDRVLVHCLASAGWLGKISLLHPHRSEFLGLLEEDFRLGDVREGPGRLARKFLAQGFKEIDADLGSSRDVGIEELEELEGDRLVESFGGKAELAKEFFKLLQCVKGSWRTRLMAWDKYLALQIREVFDPTVLMKDAVFVAVKEQLDDLRPAKTINNISDALAVALLVAELSAFEADPLRRRLPVLFDHQGELRKAIRSAGLEGALTYRYGGRSFSVLRDWRYFFLRATFGVRGRDPHSEQELLETLRAVEELRSATENAASTAVSSLGANIERLIGYMGGFEFFGEVWLGSWKDDLSRVVEELGRAKMLEAERIDTVVSLQTETIRNKFFEARELLECSIRQSAGLYHGIIDLIRAIDRRATKIQRGLAEQGRNAAEIVLILGSFRFPFPPSAHAETASVLSDLASSEGERRLDAQTRVISVLSESRSGQRLSYSTLALLLGVLWATELDQEILELAGEHGHLMVGGETSSPTEEALAFSLVWLAAFVRLTFGESERRYRGDRKHPALSTDARMRAPGGTRETDIEQMLGILTAIETFFIGDTGSVKARFAVGLAYVNFHLFEAFCRDPSPLWSVENFGSPLVFLERAVEYAKFGSRAAVLEEKQRIYALNQLVYYLAEGVRRGALRPELVEGEFEASAILLAGSTEKEGWHYRYDDSLARYYEIVGRNRNSAEAWESGRRHIESAAMNCFGDPVILAYREEYLSALSAWAAPPDDSGVGG